MAPKRSNTILDLNSSTTCVKRVFSMSSKGFEYLAFLFCLRVLPSSLAQQKSTKLTEVGEDEEIGNILFTLLPNAIW